MNQFFVKIEIAVKDGKYQYHVEYWYNTDLRDKTYTNDIPVIMINNWIKL